jgi:integrase
MIDVTNAKVGRTSTGVSGLYLHVSPRGNRKWVFRYSRPHGGGVTEHSLGPATQGNFPEAQLKVVQLRALLAQGIDPGAHARAQRRTAITFSDACVRWIDHSRAVWSASQLRSAHLLLHVHGKALARDLVPAITEDMIVSALMPLWLRAPKQARLALNMWKRVFDFAGRRSNNPATWKTNMEYRFPRSPRQARSHYPAMPYHQVPMFVAVLRPYQRASTGAVALEFLILTATRLSETVKMQWSEVNWDERLWTIPAERMKAGCAHTVPLVDRVIEILKHQYSCWNRITPFVFVGYKDNQALAPKSLHPFIREMGDPSSTIHGFRTSFKTWGIEKTSFDREMLDRCLAHKIGNAVAQAYDRAEAIDKRRKIMNAWAEFCESGIYPDS